MVHKIKKRNDKNGNLVQECNRHMGGVDLLDLLLGIVVTRSNQSGITEYFSISFIWL